MLVDSNSNHQLKCKSVTFVCKKDLQSLILLKSTGSQVQNPDYIFIPFTSVSDLKLSRYEAVQISVESKDQFAYSNSDHQFLCNGFIIPLKNLDNTFWNSKFEDIFDILQVNQVIADQIFKTHRVSWQVGFLSHLIKIKQLMPDHYCRNSYTIYNYSLAIKEQIIKNSLIKSWNFSEFSVLSIEIHLKLLPEEFERICEILSSSKTKFKLKNILLIFSKLSECLTVLNLCADCPELKSIQFDFYEEDVKWDENKLIENFRRTNGIIQKLKIKRSLF